MNRQLRLIAFFFDARLTCTLNFADRMKNGVGIFAKFTKIVTIDKHG